MSNGYTPADPAVIAALQGIQAAQEAIEAAIAAIQIAQQQIASATGQFAAATLGIENATEGVETATQQIASSQAARLLVIQNWLAARWPRQDGTIYGGALLRGLYGPNSPIVGGQDAGVKVDVSSGVARANAPTVNPQRNLRPPRRG